MSRKLTPERRQALKEKLMQDMEGQVEAYLDWYESVEDIKFRDIVGRCQERQKMSSERRFKMSLFQR